MNKFCSWSKITQTLISNFLLHTSSGLSIYFWIIKSLCFILNDFAFDGDFFSGELRIAWPSSPTSSGDYGSSSLASVGETSVSALAFFFRECSSLPKQYSLISLLSVARSLKTWMPRPRFRWVGFSNHRLYPSKCDSGHEYFVNYLFSKLNCLNLVLFLLPLFSVLYTVP